MSGRHQPAHGADSADAYVLRRYRCLVKDEEGPAWWVEVKAALGPNDAREQARLAAYRSGADSPGVIRVVEVTDAEASAA